MPGTPGAVQAVVLNASDGDTILLHPGEHYGTTVLYGRELTIGSLFLLDGDTSHVAETVIIADSVRTDTASCFVYAYDENLDGRLVGLTLTGGRGTFHLIHDIMVGGGVHVSRGGVHIERCDIRDCQADAGGGIGVQARSGSHWPAAVISDSRMVSCVGDGWGGGIYAERCSLVVRTTDFMTDTARHVAGGAIAARECAIEIADCEITECTGSVVGAAFIDASRGDLVRCRFEGSSVRDGDRAHLLWSESDGEVSGNSFVSNVGSALALELYGGSWPFRFIGNLVAGNTAMSGVSAAIMISSAAHGDCAYNIIRDNTTWNGGLIQIIDHSVARFHHNVVTDNSAMDTGLPTVLLATNHAQAALDSNLISGHCGSVVGIHHLDSGTVDARNNWWGHESGPYHPTANPGGQGDTVLSDSVLFIPWLTTPPDTTMPSGVDERSEITCTWEIMGLYPNPFNSEFRLVLAGFAGPEFQITLHDILGREAAVIHRGVMTGGSLSYTAPPRLASGVYFVRASDSHHINTRKVILLK